MRHAGIVTLACFMADKVPNIKRISNAEIVSGEWIWVLAHKDMVRNGKVLIDCLANAFIEYKDLIEGRYTP